MKKVFYNFLNGLLSELRRLLMKLSWPFTKINRPFRKLSRSFMKINRPFMKLSWLLMRALLREGETGKAQFVLSRMFSLALITVCFTLVSPLIWSNRSLKALRPISF